MNYLLFSFLKTLYFCYNSMVFLSIYNILYTIGKLWFPSFQWDCCQSEILTYFLSSQLSIQISYLSPVQLVLFKILEYSRQCKIPHSKAYALLRTDNQESCSATLGPHLYSRFLHGFQYMIYYTPLESSDSPLSNGIVVKVKFPHIFYLLKNILYISSATGAIQNTRI